MAIQTRLEDMVIGDKIVYGYTTESGSVGVFKELGTTTLPYGTVVVANPNRSSYFIYVGKDFKGRMILISEQNIQHSISWDALNSAGVATKDGIEVTTLGLDPSQWKTNIRLLTGGVSAETVSNSEWDKYIVNGPVGSDDAAWNWKDINSWTSSTLATNNARRIYRGGLAFSTLGYNATDARQNNIGFRPVLVAEQLSAPLPPLEYRYLIEHEGQVKSYTDSWDSLGAAPATEEMFTTSGMSDLSSLTEAAWKELTGTFHVLEYVNRTNEMSSSLNVEYLDKSSIKRDMTLTGVPHPQLLIANKDIDVEELSNINVSGSDNIRIIVSGDSGETWKGKSKYTEDMTTSEGAFGTKIDEAGRDAYAQSFLNAFDNNESSVFVNRLVNPESKVIIGHKFLEPVVVNCIRLIPRIGYSHLMYDSFYIEGSNDSEDGITDGTWKQLRQVQKEEISSDEWNEFDFINSVAYKYYRLIGQPSLDAASMYNINGVSTTVYYIQIGEIEMAAKSDYRIIETDNLPNVKENGFSPEEFNALTREELALLFPSHKVRLAVYLEQDTAADNVSLDTVSVQEVRYDTSPSMIDSRVIYSSTEGKQPEFFVSRNDGVDWMKVSVNEITKLDSLSEGENLKVKAVLENGLELHGISYSWI
jgi:hypothetical protein